MKVVWCWRCKMEVPMLDEEEFTKAAALYRAIFIGEGTMLSRKKPLLDYYNNLTGFSETEVNVIMHHEIALYGPECENCGRPYRTPQASFCAACGNKRINEAD